jgi:hypothetical protein
MTTYRITNRTSGCLLGDFESDSPDGAFELMHQHAGYYSAQHAATALDMSVDQLRAEVLVEEIEPVRSEYAEVTAAQNAINAAYEKLADLVCEAARLDLSAGKNASADEWWLPISEMRDAALAATKGMDGAHYMIQRAYAPAVAEYHRRLRIEERQSE